MDLNKIGGLFTLLSGETDVSGCLPLLELSAAEVRRGLREDADETDLRLCWFAAALANLRYRQICGARDGVLATYAGTVGDAPDSSKMSFAERLASSYRGMCRDLLRDEAFCFLGTGGGDA